jgi:hypothetical protein
LYPGHCSLVCMPFNIVLFGMRLMTRLPYKHAYLRLRILIDIKNYQCADLHIHESPKAASINPSSLTAMIQNLLVHDPGTSEGQLNLSFSLSHIPGILVNTSNAMKHQATVEEVRSPTEPIIQEPSDYHVEVAISSQVDANLSVRETSGKVHVKVGKNPFMELCRRMMLPAFFQDETLVAKESSGPVLRNKREIPSTLRIIPPSVIVPRVVNNPLPASKLIWILYPRHGNTAIAQGKSGVGWKLKSKLGGMCGLGMQWIFVHRTIVHNVKSMYLPNSNAKLEDVLPPTSGKHKMIQWDYRYIVSFSM